MKSIRDQEVAVMTTTIEPAEMARILKEKSAVDVIDVRTPGEFQAMHAAGSRSVPLDQLDPQEVLATRHAAAGEPIYLLCHSGTRAGKAREKFEAAGCRNVVCVSGGLQAWQAAGLPVVKGRGAISIERQVRIGAGTLVLAGALLGYFVNPDFLWLSAFVGCGLVFAGITDWCGMGLLLAKMPWNK